MSHEREQPSLVAVREGSGPRSWGSNRWHAEDIRRFPVRRELFDDLPSLFREMTDGHRPPGPLLDEGDTVVTLGSCFAQRIRDALRAAGFSSESVWVPSGLNNTFALLDFVSWCVDGHQTPAGYRYDLDAEGEVVEWQPEDERTSYRQHFAEAKAIIFTIGLAEVWQDRLTGQVFWRGVPQRIFSAERHLFRVSTVEENTENLRQLVEVVRAANATAPIVFTLSPVPLAATFGAVSCMSADCVSKSILRVALHHLESQGLANVFYWPSFEMVRWVGAHLGHAVFGDEPKGNMRHPVPHVVDLIVDAFVEAYYSAQAHYSFRERRAPSAASHDIRPSVLAPSHGVQPTSVACPE